jgi:hypothetical protein
MSHTEGNGKVIFVCHGRIQWEERYCCSYDGWWRSDLIITLATHYS